MTTAQTSWKRTPYGYWSPDGTAYIERGGEFEDGSGRYAWLTWIQVPDEWVDVYSVNGCANHAIFDGPAQFAGVVGAAVPRDGLGPQCNTFRARQRAERYYVHTNDDGWLADAKITVEAVQADLHRSVAS